ncbi:helix-turn-helix domain-containing protein [Tuberibacillus sp. Marseille-P3662]|uniref:helix-turn-helix domain-containing protein n=1 Tax=Tuberibacillus sp. Marseille-P3662 TaxID=1965358 RepID=UPI000A1CB0FA|nr:helix-turn-helix transcriptional regulator [Tuberibacillus sp. Marseille-P3662]
MKNHWLVTLRTNRNLTQEEVAKLSSIERSYYTKIENGTVPSVKVAQRIAQILDFEWMIFFD